MQESEFIRAAPSDRILLGYDELKCGRRVAGKFVAVQKIDHLQYVAEQYE